MTRAVAALLLRAPSIHPEQEEHMTRLVLDHGAVLVDLPDDIDPGPEPVSPLPLRVEVSDTHRVAAALCWGDEHMVDYDDVPRRATADTATIVHRVNNWDAAMARIGECQAMLAEAADDNRELLDEVERLKPLLEAARYLRAALSSELPKERDTNHVILGQNKILQALSEMKGTSTADDHIECVVAHGMSREDR